MGACCCTGRPAGRRPAPGAPPPPWGLPARGRRAAGQATHGPPHARPSPGRRVSLGSPSLRRRRPVRAARCAGDPTAHSHGKFSPGPGAPRPVVVVRLKAARRADLRRPRREEKKCDRGRWRLPPISPHARGQTQKHLLHRSAVQGSPRPFLLGQHSRRTAIKVSANGRRVSPQTLRPRNPFSTTKPLRPEEHSDLNKCPPPPPRTVLGRCPVVPTPRGAAALPGARPVGGLHPRPSLAPHGAGKGRAHRVCRSALRPGRSRPHRRAPRLGAAPETPDRGLHGALNQREWGEVADFECVRSKAEDPHLPPSPTGERTSPLLGSEPCRSARDSRCG